MKLEQDDLRSESSTKIQQLLLDEVQDAISIQLDRIIYSALKLKGHKFENKRQLFKFIKEKCSLEYSRNKATFLVNGESILYFTFKKQIVAEIDMDENENIIIRANVLDYIYT